MPIQCHTSSNLSDLERDGERVDHAAAGGPRLGGDRGRAARAGRQAPADPRAGRRGGRQPPDRGARLPQARGARLRHRPGGPRHLRAHAGPRQQRRSTGDDWQVYALPPDEISYSEQVLADTFSLAGRDDVISLADRLAGAEPLPHRRARPHHRRRVRGGRRRRIVLPATPRDCSTCASRSPCAGASYGYAEDADEIVITSGAQQAHRAGRARDPRAGRRGRDRVAHLHRDDDRAARHRRARDRRAGRRGRLRRRRARAPARAPRGRSWSACRAPARTRPGATCPRSGAGAWPSWPSSATSSFSRTACTPTCASRGRSVRSLRELAPGARDLRQQPLQGRGRRTARRLGRRTRPGARPHRDAQARGRLPLPHADPAHGRPLARHRRLRPPREAHDALLSRAPRRAAGVARSGTCSGEYHVDRPARRASPVGHARHARSTSARSTPRRHATA